MTDESGKMELARPWFGPTLYSIAVLIFGAFVVDWLIEPDLIARGDDPMFATVLIAMAVVLFLAPGALDATKAAYRRVWERGVVSGVDDGPSSSQRPERHRSSASPGWYRRLVERIVRLFGRAESGRGRSGVMGRVPGTSLEERYENFTHEIGVIAKSGAQWAIGVAFFVAAYWIAWVETDRDTEGGASFFSWFDEYAAMHGGPALVTVVFQMLVWLLVGAVAWKVLVIALETARFARSFRFKVIIGHPDKGGGMAVLGYMCFRLALIITVPSFLCAFWVAVLGGDIASSLLRDRYDTWESNFRIALGALIVLTLIVAVRPLRGVHRGMLRGRAEIQAELDQIASKLDERTRALLRQAPALEHSDIDQRSRQIEGDQKLISDLGRFPTWPFDRATVVKLGVSQIVPVFSMLGISGPLVDSMRGLLPTLGG